MRAVAVFAILLGPTCHLARGQQVTSTQVYVPRQVVTIEITDVADELHRHEIIRRVPALMNPGQYATRFESSRGRLIARVAPFHDVNAFAARIDFGKVIGIQGRKIFVKANPVPGAGTAAATPLNRALEGLKSSSADVRHGALEQLSEIEPTQRRDEVLRALEEPLGGADSRARSLAIAALSVWGTKDHVPGLLTWLNATDGGDRRAAIAALGRLKAPAAIEPIARRLADESDQSEAVKALVAFGPLAERAARDALASEKSVARAGACKVLEKIGTGESVAVLEAATRDADTWVRSAATRALRSVTRRQRPGVVVSRPRR